VHSLESGGNSNRKVQWEKRNENREEDKGVLERLRKFRKWGGDRFEVEGERDETTEVGVRDVRKGEELDTEVEDATTLDVVIAQSCDVVEEVGKVLQYR